MKKIILVPLMFAVISVSAQHVPQDKEIASDNLSQNEMQLLQKELDLKTQQQKNSVARYKTNALVSQRMSHVDIADIQYSTMLRTVFSPFSPDSNYIQDFGTPDYINSHGFGQTFDPTSVGFALVGQPYFHPNDPYTIDTIYVGVRYRTSSSVSGLTGDTLQVVAFKGNNQNNNVWRVGIGYSASTYPGQTARINVLCPRYTGNPTIGVPGSINAPAKMVLKYALKASDTAVNYIKIVPPAPIQVPAGEKFGVFCTFIAGYTYNPLTQVYYRSGAKGDVNNMSWLYLTRQSSTDATPYFLEPLQLGAPSEGISNTLFSNTRYAAWTGSDAFRNEYPSPSTIRGNLIDFWVTGNSTIGLHENTINKDLSVFPNPGNGKVEIVVSAGGIYNLSLVNSTGKIVYSEEVHLNGEKSISRDFSSLAKGIYILKMQGEVNSQTARLVIQ